MVFGLLCRHTAGNPSTAEMHTSGRKPKYSRNSGKNYMCFINIPIIFTAISDASNGAPFLSDMQHWPVKSASVKSASAAGACILVSCGTRRNALRQQTMYVPSLMPHDFDANLPVLSQPAAQSPRYSPKRMGTTSKNLRNRKPSTLKFERHI